MRTCSLIGSMSLSCAVLLVALAVVNASIDLSIEEEQPPGRLIGDLRDYMSETNKANANIRFSFHTQPTIPLNLDANTGILETDGRIDRDQICPEAENCEVDFQVWLKDGDSTVDLMQVSLKIIDINDHSPTFSPPTVDLHVRESAIVKSKFSLEAAFDLDSPKFGIQEYILASNHNGAFYLESQKRGDGKISISLVLNKTLDYEVQSSYNLTIVAFDHSSQGTRERSGSVRVTVHIDDDNDNIPRFTSSNYNVTISEDAPPQRTVLRVTATDADMGKNGELKYSFSDQTNRSYGHLFGIRSDTGDIYIKAPIDYETKTLYSLTVKVSDSGAVSHSSTAEVLIHLLNVNDNAPTITVLGPGNSAELQVTEGKAPGESVGFLVVEDEDINESVTCTLSHPNFSLKDRQESNSFEIVTESTLNRESVSQYILRVTCSDNGNPPKDSSKEIIVNVGDVNDNSPVFTSTSYNTNVYENNNINENLTRVHATDRDAGENAVIRYRLEADAGDRVAIDENTGDIYAKEIFDRESVSELRFHVLAIDNGNPARSSTALVTVRILDKNDQSPKFLNNPYNFGAIENNDATTQIGTVTAYDADVLYNEVRYTIVGSDKFVVDEFTGAISTNQSLDREQQMKYVFQVIARDKDRPELSATATVTVYVVDENDNHPIFKFPNTRNHTVHVSNQAPIGYTFTRVKAEDADMKRNGEVMYTARDQSHFSVDVVTGAIMVETDLTEYDGREFILDIVASDRGEIPKTTTARLRILVNSTMPFEYSPKHIMKRSNFTIVISLGCVTGVIVIILLIAIVAFYRRGKIRSKERHQALQALKTYAAESRDPDSGQHNVSSSLDSSSSSAHQMIIQNNGISHHKSDHFDDKSPTIFTAGLHPDAIHHNFAQDKRHRDPPPLYSREAAPSPFRKDPPSKPPRTVSLQQHSDPQVRPGPYNVLSRSTPVHMPNCYTIRDSQVLPSGDGDSHSSSSGEVSNADSGRGPSEAGEGLHSVHPPQTSPYRAMSPEQKLGTATPPPRPPPKQGSRKQRLLTMV